MNDYLDGYCERLTPGLWAEPLNAVTNLGFILSALLVWRLARRRGSVSPGPAILILLMFAIGIGSGLFHTFATRTTQWLDVIPIGLFQAGFLWLYVRRIIALNNATSIAIMLLFFASGALAGQFPQLLNGSLGYAPALVFVVSLALWHWRHCSQERAALPLAALLFVVSLVFRSVDNALCAHLPMGTHFLWHLCNAGVLYLSMRGLLENYSRVA